MPGLCLGLAVLVFSLRNRKDAATGPLKAIVRFMMFCVVLAAATLWSFKSWNPVPVHPSSDELAKRAPLPHATIAEEKPWHYRKFQGSTGIQVADAFANDIQPAVKDVIIYVDSSANNTFHVWFRGDRTGTTYTYSWGRPEDFNPGNAERLKFFINDGEHLVPAGIGGANGTPIPIYFWGIKPRSTAEGSSSMPRNDVTWSSKWYATNWSRPRTLGRGRVGTKLGYVRAAKFVQPLEEPLKISFALERSSSHPCSTESKVVRRSGKSCKSSAYASQISAA